MRDLVTQWYAALSVFNAAVSMPLRDVADALGIPLLSALLFGLIGATSPCQLTTNASALAYVAHGARDRSGIAARAIAYLVGKALVYTVIGTAVILVGRQLAEQSIPVIVVARKVLGPLMILLGLHMLGWLPVRFSLGSGLTERFRRRARSGWGGALLLGAAFSFAFCPTLFLLFFGLTIPLALTSPIGPLYPGVFALGTTMPLLGLAWLLTMGVASCSGYLTMARRLDAALRTVAAIVLILAGLNDTLVYWFL
jgi:cytochrome c-type biogenesis protein